MAMWDLKLWKKEHGAEYLTWDRVQSIFNNCDYIVKDNKSAKRINDIKCFEVTSFPQFRRRELALHLSLKREIIMWFKDLFNKQGEQSQFGHR